MKKILFLCVFLSYCLGANQRLVVLDPASIETLFLLKAQENIVGIASLQHSSIYPQEETSKLPSVGSFSHPSLEKILRLRPTLVILSSYSLNLEQSLKNFGIKTLYLKANHLNDIKNHIKILANIVDKQELGEELLQKFQNDLEKLQKEPFNQSGIYLFSNQPLMAFADNSIIADIFKLIGIKNLSPQSDIKRPIISSEFILKQNPDIIMLGMQINNTKEFLRLNPLLKNTNAYKKAQIYFNQNTSILLRLSPKITERILEFKENLKKGEF